MSQTIIKHNVWKCDTCGYTYNENIEKCCSMQYKNYNYLICPNCGYDHIYRIDRFGNPDVSYYEDLI